MCTVSWLRQNDGYMLYCNRDERHTRKLALGPRVTKLRGVSSLSPADGEHGGSWIGVNQFGLTLCLLNRYGDWEPAEGQNYSSRGLLLADLLDCAIGKELLRRVAVDDLKPYQPFTLLILSTDEPASLITWTGRECEVQVNAESRVPLVSSSLKEPKIAQVRTAQFQHLMSSTPYPDAGLLDRFHRSHLPERGKYSVCMHREDAATVSLSAVTVTADKIHFVYQPGAPCLQTAGKNIEMDRTVSSNSRR